MNANHFIEFKSEVEQELLCEYGKDLDDAKITDDDLRGMADQVPYVAASMIAEKRGFTVKTGVGG